MSHPCARRSPGLPAAAALAGLLLLAAACSGPRTEAPAVGSSALAPDFTLEDLKGSRVRLSDSHGKVRLIDFWATWCPPCVEEIPMFAELYRDYHERGLEILAISDENPEVIRRFVEKHDVPYTNLVGTSEVNVQYRILGLPTAYLVDREGKIVDSFVGPKPQRILEDRIRELLAEDPRG